MSQESDPIVGGPAPRGEATDSDGIQPGPRTAGRGERRARCGGTGRHRVPPTNGRFVSIIRVARRASPPEAALADRTAAADVQCAGFCEVEWSFCRADAASTGRHAEAILHPGLGARSAAPYGYIQYQILQLFRLAGFRPLDDAVGVDEEELDMEVVESLLDEELHDGTLVRNAPAQIIDNAHFLLPVISFATLAVLWAADLPVLFKSVPLSMRTPLQELVPKHPIQSALARWRTQFGVHRRRAGDGTQAALAAIPDFDDIVLEMPPEKRRRTATGSGAPAGRTKPEIDPILQIKAITFSRHLKAQRDYEEALDDAWAVDHDSEEDEPQSKKIKRASKNTLFRAFSKMDAVNVLLHRREWRAERIHDTIEAVNVLTDSSPTSGLEYQGMVAQVRRKDGSWYEVTFPGSTLSYGRADAVGKGMALLWGVWLLCGPFFLDVQYFFHKCTCITTDQGIELLTVEMPDLLAALLRWIDGEPFESLHAYVRQGHRLFPVAIRLTGWSHVYGNLAKHCAFTWRKWSEKLDLIRGLVRFWRNKTWRKHVQRALEGRDDLELRIMDRFTADLAKWRYQTLETVLSALDKLRHICQVELRAEWFANTQERETMATVFTATKDGELWRFITAARREVYVPNEKNRRWGMVCSCPEHLRQRREENVSHISCYFNGRRLEEAWPFIVTESDRLMARARALTPADVEGDVGMVQVIRRQMEYMATNMRNRHKYLDSVPYTFARAKTQDGARRFLEQVAAHPIAEHDLVTRNIMEQFGYLLQQLAENGTLHHALEDGIRVFNLAMLDESRGEMYHGQMAREKRRAPASGSKHLKQSTRMRTGIKYLRHFKKQFGPRSSQVTRYEWRNYKRLLQGPSCKTWRPMRIEKDFFLLHECIVRTSSLGSIGAMLQIGYPHYRRSLLKLRLNRSRCTTSIFSAKLHLATITASRRTGRRTKRMSNAFRKKVMPISGSSTLPLPGVENTFCRRWSQNVTCNILRPWRYRSREKK